MRLAVLGTAALGIACPIPGRAPAPQGDPTYVRRVAELRAGLDAIPMEVDTSGGQAAIRTAACDKASEVELAGHTVSLSETGCYRCELASARDPDGIDPEVIDAVGIALARYPASFLRASRIERIALCRILEREGEPPGGERPERIAGTVDLKARRILLSLEAFIGHDYDPSDPFTGEDVLHHELFHLLELAITPAVALDDPEWRVLNAVDFTYRGQGAEQAGLPGFVNDYATTNEQEDRASTFQYMMARPAELCALAGKDPVVAAKARLLWNRVAAEVGDEFLRRRVDCLTYRGGAEPETLHLGSRTTVLGT